MGENVNVQRWAGLVAPFATPAEAREAAYAMPKVDLTECGHREGELGCALPLCDGIPTGVPVVRESGPKSWERTPGMTGMDEVLLDLAESVKWELGIDDVTLPVYGSSLHYERDSVRNVTRVEFAAAGHPVMIVMYETGRARMPQDALWVDGNMVNGALIAVPSRISSRRSIQRDAIGDVVVRAGVPDTERRRERRRELFASVVGLEHGASGHTGDAAECEKCRVRILGAVDDLGHRYGGYITFGACLRCGAHEDSPGRQATCTGTDLDETADVPDPVLAREPDASATVAGGLPDLMALLDAAFGEA